MGGHTSSTGVTETRGDVGTTGAVTPVPSFLVRPWQAGGCSHGWAVPRLRSERGLLLTHERPPGDVAFLHPSLAVGGGGAGLRLQEGQLTSWIQLGLPPKAQHGATPQFPQPSFPCRGHRGMGERETRGWRTGAGWFPAATPPWPADCSRPSCQVSISPSADPASFPASSHPAVLSENSPLAGWGGWGSPHTT